MNQRCLVRQVAAETGLGTGAATAAVAAVLTVVTGAIARDETVRLPGFGTFYVTVRPRHTVRIPRTGALATRMPSFRPGKMLREATKAGEAAGQEKSDTDG